MNSAEGRGLRNRFWNLAAACGMLASVAGIARSEQILQTWTDSLTAYLPGAASSGQDIWPLHQQRGVNLDGSSRGWSALGWKLAGNPLNAGGAESWNANQRMGDLRLDLGAYAPAEVDLSLPSNGFRWVVGRTYNGVQVNGGSHRDSNGPQGLNWFQMSQPEIVFVNGATDADDAVYILYGADRYIEFQRADLTSTVFKAKNGAAGLVQYASGSPDTYTYTDQHGNQTVFFGGNTSSGRADWQIWKMTDAAGNTAYVGDASSASTAASSGYNADQTIAVAYDAATTAGGGGHRYTYTYTTIDSVSRLTRVKAEVKTGGTWSSPTSTVEVGKVEYAYYQTGDNTYGDNGNLKLVTVTTPLTDSGVSLVKKKHYRYYTGTYNGSTNPGEPNAIKMVVGFEGYRNYDWTQDTNLDDDTLTASTSSLQSFSEAYFEYASGEYRVGKAFFNGECGCAGGTNGLYEFSYGVNGSFSNTAGYDTAWKSRVVIEHPDATFETRYFDEVGQPIDRVITDITPGSPSPAPKVWATGIVRDGGGRITELRTPASISSYNHSTGIFTASNSAGLIHEYERLTSGDRAGFVSYRKHRNAGTGSGSNFDQGFTYEASSTAPKMTIGSVDINRPIIKESDSYELEAVAVPTAQRTATAIAMHAGAASLTLKSVSVSAPAVNTLKNGSGNAEATKRYARADGTTAFNVNATSIYSYTQHVNGLIVKRIDDANPSTTAQFASGDDPDTDFGVSSPPNVGTDNLTTYTYDNQGRLDTVTDADSHANHSQNHQRKSYYSKLADGRMVTISVPLVDSSGTTTYYGPMSYSVSNHAGKVEAQGTIGITSSGITTAMTGWIDESDADPITAVDIGSLVRLGTTMLDASGTRENAVRTYFAIPGSGAGTEGTHYDAVRFGYDDMGRRWRTKQPSGTISRAVYDTLGRTIESWVGTNDSSSPGGESSGTDNMTKVAVTEYDGSAGSQMGNSHVTKRTVDEDGDWTTTTTDQRVTRYINDARGRVILIQNPLTPHTVNKFDNLNRVIATGQYNAVTGLSVTTDPTSDATADSGNTDRLTLSETLYDDRGQVWKTIRHKIDDTDGSSDDTLESLTWYDPDGRAIKSKNPGGLSKTRYDHLGRATHQWTLATDDDANYGDVFDSSAKQTDVLGDIVLEESQTAYEQATGLVLMQARIQRFHDDLSNGTSGPLDTNLDGDPLTHTAIQIKGRISIAATWYDDLNRPTETVAFGTYGSGNATTFARSAMTTAPSRSDTELVTSYVYATDGQVQDVTDPRGKVTRSVRDAMGRSIATISNYVNGTPSGATGDDDNYVRNVYANGLQTQMWVDLDGDNAQDSDDQVTTYTYGTIKGGSAGDSSIATGHLLQKTAYPDSASGSDTVTHAYNAQSQPKWTKDQAGNIIETTFDVAGRPTHRRVSTLISGFDGAVLRISAAYNTRGQVETVTQYNNATVGSGSIVDEVKYTYDDWSNVTSFEQDRDSAVSGGGNQYTVGYSWTKATPSGAHDTLRLTGMTLPGSGDTSSLTFTYDSSGNSLDDATSRVSRLQTGSSPTTRATYSYLGAAQLVGTDVIEPDVYSRVYGSGAANYDAIDRFGRVTNARWTKDISPARNFYDLTLTYDRASNITSTSDAVLHGFDVLYSMDNRNRLIRAEEGTLATGSLTSRTRDQQWTLSQPGNWARNKVDLDGDGSFAAYGELDDTSTFNTVNELTARDTDSNASNNYTLTYDAVGNLTDDGEDYTYVYDAFGRLVTIKNRSNSAVVAQYTYNGMNYRTSWKYDTDTDGDVDGSDLTYRFAYDIKWRMVATFRGSDSAPKERFIWHNAGMNGRGNSSYIDSVLFRDRDMTNSWTGSADGTLEERHYYCQNWRADVSVILKYANSVWRVAEWVKYSAYGVPFSVTPADHDLSGFVDLDDDASFDAGYTNGIWRAHLDLDMDGLLTSNDEDIFDDEFVVGESGGRFVLSRDSINNRIGFASYQYEPTIGGSEQSVYHVRNRVYNANAGRWISRDPVVYEGGNNLFEYCLGDPVMNLDYAGLKAQTCGGLVCQNDTPPTLPPSDPSCADKSQEIGTCFACCEYQSSPNEAACMESCRQKFNSPPSVPPPFEADIGPGWIIPPWSPYRDLEWEVITIIVHCAGGFKGTFEIGGPDGGMGDKSSWICSNRAALAFCQAERSGLSHEQAVAFAQYVYNVCYYNQWLGKQHKDL
jgi:RHS repeat-associated protein